MQTPKVEHLKKAMDTLLRRHHMAGFAGAFFTTGDDPGVLVINQALPKHATISLRKQLQHIALVVGGDLRVNCYLEEERPAESFFRQLTQLEEPEMNINILLTLDHVNILFDIAQVLLAKGKLSTSDPVKTEAAQILANTMRAYLPSERVASSMKEIAILNATLESNSFGAGILRAGLDELKQEVAAQRQANDAAENN